MTDTMAEPALRVERTPRAPGRFGSPALPSLAAHGTVAVAVLWWAFGLTHGAGGRDPHTLTVGEVLAVLALAAVRPWRVLPRSWTMLASAVAVAPLVTCVVDRTGWFGANQAASYGYASAMFLVIAAYARTTLRRSAVAAIVLAAAAAQFAWSLVAWVGSGSPSTRMVGTIYWHDQYAAFLLAPVILGVLLAVTARTPLRIAGALVAVIGTAGIVYSTSRSVLALAVAGWIVAVVAGIAAASTRPRAAARAAGLAAVAVLVVMALPGPPLFQHRASPLQATQDRAAAGESVSTNTGYRVEFWRQAAENFADHPVTGTGIGSFGAQASGYAKPGEGHSALAHSAVMQALSDGGLLLGVPLVAAISAVGWGLLRRLRPRAWVHTDGVGIAAIVASGALTAHALVDFDWTYPACFAMSAIVAALAMSTAPDAWTSAAESGADTPVIGNDGRRVAAVAVTVLALCCLVGGVAAVHGGWHLTAPARATGAETHLGETGR